jgi:hypothetical protein
MLLSGSFLERSMIVSRGLIAITILNVVLVLVNFGASIGPVLAEASPPILRARALQIVDEQGRIRASLAVLPASTGAGVATQETVLLRLITERGRPTVKIAASEEHSGLSVAGPTGTTDTYAILSATETASSLRLRSEDGREQLIKP